VIYKPIEVYMISVCTQLFNFSLLHTHAAMLFSFFCTKPPTDYCGLVASKSGYVDISDVIWQCRQVVCNPWPTGLLKNLILPSEINV